MAVLHADFTQLSQARLLSLAAEERTSVTALVSEGINHVFEVRGLPPIASTKVKPWRKGANLSARNTERERTTARGDRSEKGVPPRLTGHTRVGGGGFGTSEARPKRAADKRGSRARTIYD